MSTSQSQPGSQVKSEERRDEKIREVLSLVDTVEAWANELHWSTRRIDKALNDAELGPVTLPALILQFETTKALLEPISLWVTGVQAVVDLYVMPAYDDIANLYLTNGEWHLYHPAPEGAQQSMDGRVHQLLSKDSLAEVLEGMRANVTCP